MKSNRYSDSEIMKIVEAAKGGMPIEQLCREHGMSRATFYKWRSRYGGIDMPMIQRMKDLEAENRRLKKMYAEERIKADILQLKTSKNLRLKEEKVNFSC